MAVLSKDPKPNRIESRNPLKLNWGLCSNFDECKSFLESNSPDILALCETNMDESIDSGSFSVIDYLLLIRKDSVTFMHGLPIYLKEGLLLHETYLWKTYRVLIYIFDRFYFIQSLTSFSFADEPLNLYVECFDVVLSNIDKVLSVSPSANLLVF